MKSKLKPVKLSAKRAVAATNHAVVPLRERRLNFGGPELRARAGRREELCHRAATRFVHRWKIRQTAFAKIFSVHQSRDGRKAHGDFLRPTPPTLIQGGEIGAASAYEKKVWGKMPGRERGKYLYRIARLIQEKSRDLAVLETMDGGKPIKESRDVDLPLVAAHFFYYAGWADKLKYAFPGKTPRPLGVAGQIIPWNFPLLMAACGKIAPALACGNTVVLKPAETTSITALRLAQIFQEAELPEGVVNIVTGAGETGAALVNHPDVNKIAFTGSTEVGKRIAQLVAGTKKKLTLELGGKAANILFEDAPIDQAIEGVINGILFQPRPRLLRRFAAVRAGRDLFQGHQETARPHPDVARRQSAGQKYRCGGDQFAAAARKNPRSGAERRGRRRGVDADAVHAPGERLLVSRRRFSTGVSRTAYIAWRRRKFSGRC